MISLKAGRSSFEGCIYSSRSGSSSGTSSLKARANKKVVTPNLSLPCSQGGTAMVSPYQAKIKRGHLYRKDVQRVFWVFVILCLALNELENNFRRATGNREKIDMGVPG